jgi:RNA exonuclease 1
MQGHDSKEDANAAGDLVRLALAKEWQKMKREGWILEHGVFKAPSPREPPPGAPTGPSSRKRSRDEMEIEDGELEG